MFAVLDGGTTNTRIYLADERCRPLAVRSFRMGGRDVSLSGSTASLKQTIEREYAELLRENGLTPAAISFIMATGMLTSELGLIELKHLTAPAGLKELAAGVVRVADPSVIDLGGPVYFVRGVTNRVPTEQGLGALMDVDFMRGEETQYLGVVKSLGAAAPLNIITLSSHTKICYIDADERIACCKTTISGQVYEALKKQTLLSKSLASDGGEPPEARYDELVDVAVRCVRESGLLHALMGPRFLQVLTKNSSAQERDLFVNAAIAADDLTTLAYLQQQGCMAERFVLYGKERRCKLYSTLLRKEFGLTKIRCIFEEADVAALCIRGAYEIHKAVCGDTKEE